MLNPDYLPPVGNLLVGVNPHHRYHGQRRISAMTTTHTDIVDAVQTAQERHETPAVSRGEIEPHFSGDEFDSALRRAVRSGRVAQFDTADTPIYWIPVDDQTADERHTADTDTPNWWQRQYGLGDTLLRASAILFAVGLGIIFADGPVLGSVSVPSSILEGGEILFLIAIVTVILSVVVMLVTALGNWAAGRGWVPADISLPQPW